VTPPGVLLAIDFGGTKIEIALASWGGSEGGGTEPRVLGRTRLETLADEGAPQAVGRALDASEDLLAVSEGAGLRAVGVSTMGFTHAERVDLAPNVPGWEDLRLPAALRARFSAVPVAIDNDVRAAARAELRWGGLRGAVTALYVNLGTGVAATIITGGRVLEGAHGIAGEVGYWLVRTGDTWGRLEEEVGGRGVRRRADAAGLRAGFEGLLSSPSSTARALTEEVIDAISAHVTNMALMVDPERVVLGGGYVGSPRVVEAIRDRLAASFPLPARSPVVAVGEFGSDAALYGAVALAEDAAATR